MPEGGRTHPILDNAAPWMSASVEVVAQPGREVARSPPPAALGAEAVCLAVSGSLGFLVRLCPPLGDRLVIAMQRQDEHAGAALSAGFGNTRGLIPNSLNRLTFCERASSRRPWLPCRRRRCRNHSSVKLS